jgi:hypothetical protein
MIFGWVGLLMARASHAPSAPAVSASVRHLRHCFLRGSSVSVYLSNF